MTHQQHSFSVDTACDCGLMLSEYTRSLATYNAKLVKALEEAVDLIEIWHGITTPSEIEAQAWKIYQCSPEMRRISAALATARGEA